MEIEGVNNQSKYNKKIDIGYFSKVNGNVIFTNDKYAILFTEDSAIRLSGYERTIYYESVTVIEDHFLAVSDMKKGIFIYEMVGDQLSKVEEILPADFVIFDDVEENNSTDPELALLDIVYLK